jgi:hypothetical protein
MSVLLFRVKDSVVVKGQRWVMTGSPQWPKPRPDVGVGQVMEFRRPDGSSTRTPLASLVMTNPEPPLGALPKFFCFDADVLTEQDCPVGAEVWIP